MRQRDDFAEALNRLAICEMAVEDIAMFKSRQINVTGAPPTPAIRLFYSNKDVDEYNEKSLNAMDNEGAISVAVDHCEGKGKEAWRTALLKSAANVTGSNGSSFYNEAEGWSEIYDDSERGSC
jgi:hypothetical protein